MSAQLKIYSFDDFSTGLNQRSSKYADVANVLSADFGMKSAAAANNVRMTQYGLEKFPGYNNYLLSAITGTPTVTGLYYYKKTGVSAANYWIVTAGTKIYTASGGSLTEIYSGVTAGAYFQFKTYNNVCLMMNGVDPMLYYDGTTCATVSFIDPSSIIGTAKPSFAEIFRNRIFYSGDATFPSRIWTPRPGTYNNFDNTFSTVDAFDVSVGDGHKITGLRSLQDNIMVIYKEESTHRLEGASPFGSSVDPFVIKEVSRKIGCIAPRTIVEVSTGDQFFLSKNGFKSFLTVQQYGDIKSADLTDRIPDELADINFATGVIAKAFAVYVDTEDQIYLHVPTGSSTTNNQIYVFDVKTRAIQPRKGITASYGAVIDRTYYTGDYAGQIHQQLSTDSYNGVAIESFWESKWIAIGGLKNKKKFKHLLIDFESAGRATITVQWQIMRMDGSIKTLNYSSSNQIADSWDFGLWDSAEWNSESGKVFKKNNLGRGRAIKIKIINNNANERWKIRKIELGIQNLGQAAA